MKEPNEYYLWKCVINGNINNLQIFLTNNNCYKNYTMKYVPPISFAYILSSFKVEADVLESIGKLLDQYHLLDNNKSNVNYVEICFSNRGITDFYSNYSHTIFYDYYFNVLKENVFYIRDISSQDFLNKIVEYVTAYANYHFVFLWRRQKNLPNNIIKRLHMIGKLINKNFTSSTTVKAHITPNELLSAYSLNMV